MLELRQVNVFYGGIHAIRNVDLSVEAGSLVALVGPNGAGKSTLLNAISGIVRARSGRLIFDGEDITAFPPHRIARRGLIQVPEGRRILGPLSVEENLRLGRLARGGRTGGASSSYDVDSVFELFPVLAERRRQAGGSLSGGQQQMLAIARALMGHPRLLVIDEPSLGLSPVMTSQVFLALAELRLRGITILIVEQNARRALASTDHAHVIEQGRIVRSGPSAELAADPAIIAHYLPSSDLPHG